jgi:hypothetical protein
LKIPTKIARHFQFSIFNFQLLVLMVALLGPAPPAFGWGEHGHLLSNEAAVLGLPTDMPHFFLEGYSGLVWLGPEPDRWRNGGESLEKWGSPDHFLDHEYVEGLELPRSRYDFIELMESSGRLKRFGIESDTTGFSPWRIAELSEMLTNQFRRWRFTTPGTTERRALESEIIHTAGNLGHYVADAANPHHATIHYNGWASAENPAGFATDCDTHSRFESQFVSHAVNLSHVVGKMGQPVARTDYFTTAVDFLRESNQLVDDLYVLDRAKAFDLFSPRTEPGVAFASERLAAGASLLRDFWWSAWKNSARAPRRRED